MNRISVLLSKIKINYLLSFLIVLLVLVYFHIKGFIPYDEGWFVYAGIRFLHGQIPYKDFEFIYNPGGIYLSALSLFLFGKSILSTRILAFVISLFSVLIIYLFSRKLKLPPVVIFLMILNFIFWGPGHINFVWPVMLCIFSGLATIYFFFLAAQTEDETKIIRFLFLAGLFSAVTFLFKQNFGFAIVINDLLIFLVLKQFRNMRFIIFNALGFLTIVGVQFAYMLITNSLLIYLKEFYYFMFIKIIKDGMLASDYPWQYPSPIFLKFFKFIFYLLPVILSLGSLMVLFRKNIKLFFIPTFVILYYLLSIRPTTDYIHLTPLIAVSFISLIACFPFVEKKVKSLIVIIACLFLLLGIYSSLFRNYYRWNAPLINENFLLFIPHSFVLTDQGTAQKAAATVEFIDTHTKKGEPIFIYGLNPMYYMLSERDNPTRYDYFLPGVQDNDSVNDAIKVLAKDKVKLILSDFPLNRKTSKDEDYILEKYNEIKYMDNYFYILKGS